MKNNKEIIIKLVVLITFVLSILVASTYAWLNWISTNNTELTLSFGNLADVIYTSGDDISTNNLGPVLSYEFGESTKFIIKKRNQSLSLLTSVSLNITTISTELRVSSFKWVLLTSNNDINYTKLIEGSFLNQATGNLSILENSILPVDITYYKFIIYIDGNMENNPNMQNKTFAGTLNVNIEEE